jgi:hypothetical protein
MTEEAGRHATVFSDAASIHLLTHHLCLSGPSGSQSKKNPGLTGFFWDFFF